MADLPNRPLKLHEVAIYFSVTERTIRIWIERGHLKTEKYNGRSVRVARESVEAFRLKSRIQQE